MIKFKCIYKLFIALSFVVFCGQLLARDKPGDLIQVRTIEVSPYGMKHGSKLSGIYYDLANVLIEEAGLKSNHRIYPYARIVNELKTGKTDLTIMFKYQELQDYVSYIAPLPTLVNVVIGLKGNKFSAISDLEGKTLGYLRGARLSEEIDQNSKIHKYPTKDFSQSIKMLNRGRVDAIIGPMAPILSAAEAMGTADKLDEPLFVSQRTPWLQMSKKSKFHLDVKDIGDTFISIIKQETLKKIQHRYSKASES